jgi:dimethylamine/trimethylamine dehydrogenase
VSRDPRYDVLFEPIQIGPKTMKNRFYQTPHASGLGAQYPGAEAYFRGMKAEGGWAVVNTGMTSICPEYDHTGHEIVSRIWDEADVRNWSLMCERIHEHGGLAGIELMATGTHVTGFETRLPARAVSGIGDDCFWVGASYAMDKDDIRRLQADYVAAARRALSAGFDIVNVMGAEVLVLPTAFLMKRYNDRTDEYGGSFENRARFWLETLEQVREAVGEQCAITARFSIDTLDGTEEGIRVDHEGVQFIELADHLVDFWDLQVGGEDPNTWAKDVGPSRFYNENFQGQWLEKVRSHTEKPIVGVGRFTSPDTMVNVIRSGQLDIIGAARASISDPFLPRKIEEGRIEEIRECIGCNVCVSRVNTVSRIICTQNPTTGEEYRRGWHPERVAPVADPSANVLVIGAGPAGLECALTLARRGVEHVHLVDAGARAGGHFDWVPKLPGLAEWSRVVHYRLTMAEKLRNLTVIPKKRMSADDVLEYGAQLVVVATGARWAGDGRSAVTRSPIIGADPELTHILTPEQVMVQGKEPPGDRVLVYDTEGYFMGVSLAERLAREGRKVIYVTPLEKVGAYMQFTGEDQMMVPALHELGVEMWSGHVVNEIAAGGVRGALRALPSQLCEWEADSVVLSTMRIPCSELYRDLRERRSEWADADVRGVYRVGDCLTPRQQVADAIFDAHRLAREIESPDPMIAGPWIREERFLSTSDADYDAMLRAADPDVPRSVLREPV